MSGETEYFTVDNRKLKSNGKNPKKPGLSIGGYVYFEIPNLFNSMFSSYIKR